jgi:hypothetical protein
VMIREHNAFVLGLDLSLRNTGMCRIPMDWDGKFSSLSFEEYGSKRMVGPNNSVEEVSYDDIRRRNEISCKILRFAGNGTKHIAIEGYAFSRGKSGSASLTRLAELGGVVKSDIWSALGITSIPIPSTSARKTVFGTMRRKGKVKDQVEKRFVMDGFVFPSHDIMDAFVVAYAHYCTIYNTRSLFLSA